MGKLVRFKGADRLKSRHAAAKGAGKVIMFTGVRYERDNRETDGKRPTGDKRRRRI